MIYGFSLAIIMIIILILHMWRMAFLERVLVQKLSFTHFPETFGEIKIFFISDIHRRSVSDKLIDFTRGNADIVIIGGDLREGGISLQQVKENIIKLKEVGPIYFVWGNNDYEDDYHALKALLSDLDVTILDNTAIRLESNQGEGLFLLGINDISEERDRYDLALSDSDESTFKILVSHNPLIHQQVKDEHHVGLVLSGHTHGGQIRLFGHGPYELGGIIRKNETLFLTSNGYGTSTIPLRLEAKPETHLLILQQGASSHQTEVFDL